MGTIVDVLVSTGEFALTETFDCVPDAVFEPIRIVAHEPRRAMPLLWAGASDLERLDDALRADETTRTVTQLSMGAEHALYRVTWCGRTQAVTETFVEANGTLLNAHGTADCWSFRVLFPDQSAVSSAYDVWRDRGFDPSIRHVNELAETLQYSGTGLSQCQHEVLTEAFRTGYYDIPRGITLGELATNFDVSHQALSERLRRGHRALLETTVCQSSPSVRQQP
ncbi:helix-turn-helix domain-containing protein [Halalkalirubrum salinum]|uniref:helix-turn-helix domain-containing protein n=1 Tax=Halalkalirubrum salinum TaxID=2563889 RepID=UPI001484F073|nr:helix-turn-helix domain-containing protein [Halalkalirubrum salinum]